MVDHRPWVEQYPLCAAAQGADVEACRHQVVDQMLGVDDADAQTNLSPVMHATQKGTALVLTYLLEAGGEPNRRTNYEFSVRSRRVLNIRRGCRRR